MNDDVFKVILLTALPASGKSEVRNFMANMEPEVLEKEFHIGETLQLDDYPYVYLMRCIDRALEEMGEPRIYYSEENSSFINRKDYGTLIELLNEDYYDLINRHQIEVDSAAKYLFNRFERASRLVGFPYRIYALSEDVQQKLTIALEQQCRQQLDEKLAGYSESLQGKTIMIELARGGRDGAGMPLLEDEGYQYSLPLFAPEILEKATILYIWVTAQESRRKNFEREDPNNPGSNLFHGVPLNVMMNDYGCDDMDYLRSISKKEDTITLAGQGREYYLPIGVIDNRVDMTSFLRKDKSQWSQEEIQTIREAIKQATDTMYANYSK